MQWVRHNITMYYDGSAMYVSLYLGYHCICVCTECVDYIVVVAGIDDSVLVYAWLVFIHGSCWRLNF